MARVHDEIGQQRHFPLGIKAVIAESYERIHRSNLVGMGIAPLVFINGQKRNNF